MGSIKHTLRASVDRYGVKAEVSRPNTPAILPSLWFPSAMALMMEK
ncbi:MAG: hypothetical protein SO016_09300 [Lachnospiraceae bacterium]|nr:hypothetical protein [Lachnospiraceae bacterium]